MGRLAAGLAGAHGRVASSAASVLVAGVVTSDLLLFIQPVARLPRALVEALLNHFLRSRGGRERRWWVVAMRGEEERRSRLAKGCAHLQLLGRLLLGHLLLGHLHGSLHLLRRWLLQRERASQVSRGRGGRCAAGMATLACCMAALRGTLGAANGGRNLSAHLSHGDEWVTRAGRPTTCPSPVVVRRPR